MNPRSLPRWPARLWNTPCQGRASAAFLAFLATLAIAALLTGVLFRRPQKAASSPPLIIYCAAGLRVPMEQIVKDYAAGKAPFELVFGASQTLLSSMELSKRGDLFLPGDESYLELARARGLVAETIPIARMRVVLAVQKGNPKNIRSLAGLSGEGFVLGQASPEGAAIGKLTRQALEKAGLWEGIQRRTRVFKATVPDVANDLKLGALDAGFIWDAMLKQYPTLEAVETAELKDAVARVSIGVIRGATHPAAALRFARYAAARDRGQAAFASAGFTPAGGDAWASEPELRLMAGAMLRPAIEETLRQFERREGARVTSIYNGCGILVAQMRAGTVPDAYFSCDTSFMDQVKDLYIDPEPVSLNTMVILVPKGNPRAIRELKDLARPGLQLGLAHEKQSALGALTQRLLATNGLYDAVRKNLKTESATGDFLVNQLRTGSLDAVIVYISNAAASKDQLDVIPITAPGGVAIQPMAVAKEARYPQLAARLLDALRATHSRQRFEALGFEWRNPPRTLPAAGAVRGGR